MIGRTRMGSTPIGRGIYIGRLHFLSFCERLSWWILIQILWIRLCGTGSPEQLAFYGCPLPSRINPKSGFLVGDTDRAYFKRKKEEAD